MPESLNGQRLISEVRLVRHERGIYRALTKALDIHKAKAVASLRTITAAAPPPDPFDLNVWETTLSEIVLPRIRGTVEDFAKWTTDFLALDPAIRAQILGNIDVEQYIAEFMDNCVTLGEDVADDVMAAINEGVGKGEGEAKLIDRVRDFFKDDQGAYAKAQRIARTETHNAAEGTKETSARGAQQAGFIIAKRWVAHIDARTRREHARADGQEVMMDDDFTVGTASGPRPGRLGAKEHDINCRCASIFRVLDPGELPAGLTPEQADENEQLLEAAIERQKEADAEAAVKRKAYEDEKAAERERKAAERKKAS